MVECKSCEEMVTPKKGRCPNCSFKIDGYVDPVKYVQVHLVTTENPKKPGESGWVHTHGLADFGLPELEMRGLPLYMGAPATVMINRIANYLLNGPKPVSVGQTFMFGPMQICQFEKAEPIVNDPNIIATHYQVVRWLITDKPMRGLCLAQHHTGCESED